MVTTYQHVSKPHLSPVWARYAFPPPLPPPLPRPRTPGVPVVLPCCCCCAFVGFLPEWDTESSFLLSFCCKAVLSRCLRGFVDAWPVTVPPGLCW